MVNGWYQSAGQTIITAPSTEHVKRSSCPTDGLTAHNRFIHPKTPST